MKITIAACLIVGLIGASHAQIKAPDCTILLDDAGSWPEYPPIINDPIYGYIYPEGTYSADDRNIVVADGDTINLSCSGNNFLDSALSAEEFVAARCSEGAFYVTPPGGSEDSTAYDFIELGCDAQPDERNNEPGLDCGPASEGYEIQYGFDTLDGFTALFALCFDEPGARTLYARHVLWHNIKARDTGNDRPSFKTDGYYDFDVNEAYTQAQQAITIEGLTGIDSYVDTSSDVYLARGHYSPNSDFVYYSGQDATYYFVNVGPQWQCFNAGNWLNVENGVRYYIEDASTDIDLIVYTGSHGVLQLADTNDDMVDIYLVPETNQLPVPMYYWKVVINSADSTGLAIIGVNNPHLDAADIDLFKVCTPIEGNALMAEVENGDDIYKGVTYACAVEDAAAVFEEIPDFGDLGILG